MTVSVKIAVIFPSRGLMFSRTGEELLTNLRGFNYKIFFSHKRPIPDCFEYPLASALRDKEVTHVWFVEDDMVLEPDTLTRLLSENANVVTADYPVTKDGRGSVFYDKGKNVVFCGTGCLLVKRKVFDNLLQPFFTDKIRWKILNYGEKVKLIGEYSDRPGYGTHDITFSIKLWKQGIKIKVIGQTLGQRKLLELGKSGSNNGAHKIEVWKKIVKNKRLKQVVSEPIALGAKSRLVTIDTPTGGVNTTQKHAETLVKQGLASYPPKTYTLIDDTEVEL